MMTERVLFLCTGNSARSQMAEGFLRHVAGDRFDVTSAGIDPKGVNPLAIEAMQEIGVDISGHESKTAGSLLDESFRVVVTVCDNAKEQCPIFPGAVVLMHWALDDPAAATGSKEERLVVFRRIRDEIVARVRAFASEYPPKPNEATPRGDLLVGGWSAWYRPRMLILYDDVFSPYARKVRIALYEKDVPFERVRALHGDCNRTDFLHVNPRAEVPALLDDGFALFDSTIICEYIEDRHPAPPIYPADPRARAKCRLIEDLADTQLDAALYAITLIEFGRGESHAEMHAAAARDLERLYDELEALLGDQEFFCGSYSLADIAVLPHVMAATFLGFAPDTGRHRRLEAWLGRVQQRPAMMRDNADVLQTMQRLQEEGWQAFDPYRVQWRSDRLEWVMKHGFADWFAEESRAGRVFFPLR